MGHCIRESLSSTKLLLLTLSVKNFSEFAPSYSFQMFCHYFQLSKLVKKSQNKIGRIKVFDNHVFDNRSVKLCPVYALDLKAMESGYFYVLTRCIRFFLFLLGEQ